MKKGFTLVEIMIVVAIIALLAAVGIPNLLRARLNAAQAYAQATLRSISTACESYAAANSGNYPDSYVADLVNATPSYISTPSSLPTTAQGYTFTCGTLTATAYSCTATSTQTGATNYTITTGGILQ